MSPFEEILLLYPSKDWDWRRVSVNPSVSFDFIREHSELPWVPAYVSCNPSITEDRIRANLDYPWVLEKLCMNPNISIGFFNEFIFKPEVVRRMDWSAISANPGITMLDVIHYPKHQWSDRYLSANPNLTSSFILNEGNQRKWFAPSVSSNPGISERDIFKSTMKSMFHWDYCNLSANPNLPMAFVDANRNQDWNFHSISTQVSLTDVRSYHQIPWDGHGLSINPNISMDYVFEHPAVEWHVPTLLLNSAISVETYQLNRSWFHSHISCESAIACLSANSSITLEWISRNKHAIDWKRMSSNTMTK
jgi:hypothetical protein